MTLLFQDFLPVPATLKRWSEERVKIAREALAYYIARPAGAGYDHRDNVVDLLADLRHFCAKHGVSFEQCVQISRLHHDNERTTNHE